jgi:hypothetical protein
MVDQKPSAVASKACSPWRVCSGFLAEALRTTHAAKRAFALAELVVSLGVLVLLALLATQLLNNAATVTTLGHGRMDVDSQAREVLDRMAIDFAKMLKRSDIDYYLKSPGSPQTGNDQIAFYTASPGYFATVPTPAPAYTTKSPISLVAYRINANSTWSSYNRMARLGHGLAWNAFSSTGLQSCFYHRQLRELGIQCCFRAAKVTPSMRSSVLTFFGSSIII